MIKNDYSNLGDMELLKADLMLNEYDLDLFNAIIDEAALIDNNIQQMVDAGSADFERMIELAYKAYGVDRWEEVINEGGRVINYKASTQYMDPEIVEQLHQETAPCTNQAFFTAYEQAHLKAYGEPWEISKANPVW